MAYPASRGNLLKLNSAVDGKWTSIMLPSNFKVPCRKFPTESWPETITLPYGFTLALPVMSMTFTPAENVDPKFPSALNPTEDRKIGRFSASPAKSLKLLEL